MIARMKERIATIIATGFGSGYSPFAPGTAGSVVGLALFVPLALLDPRLQFVATAAVFFLGVWSASLVAKRSGVEDPGLVVVDEIAGMWITLLLLPLTWQVAVVGFFAFRVMDVFKPYPARDFEKFPRGWGIMADDVMAGIYANLTVRVVALVWPLW
jgi:phosphatidylglycerophosphatase A